MSMTTLRGGITDIIITIMTERHIYDTTLGKMLEILQSPIDGDTVLDTQHDRLQALSFVLIEICWGTSDTDIPTILIDNRLYLVKDLISIGSRIKRRLRQIGHHNCCILPTFRHLMQINQDFRIPMIKTDSLREEHRCVTVGVKCQHTIM